MSEGGTAKKPSSELGLRVLSALVLLPIALTATYLGGRWFGGLAALVSLLIYSEFTTIAGSQVNGGAKAVWKRPVIWSGLILLLGVMAAWFAVGPGISIMVGSFSFILLLAIEMALARRIWISIGFAYAFLPFLALVMIRGEGGSGLVAILYIFACVWAADTAAYFSGRAIGGPKLAPRISPKKTWAGFAGGLLGSIIIANLLLLAFGYVPSVAATVVALALSLASQIGDLFESWVKRVFGKKDSGRLIPGHGGMLDRVDGLIFASIVAWLGTAVAAGGLPTQGVGAGGLLLGAIVLP